MSFPRNQEENRTTSTEETGRPLTGNSEQSQINVLNVHHHHHIDQQLVQVHNQRNVTNIVHQPEQTNVRSGDQEASSSHAINQQQPSIESTLPQTSFQQTPSLQPLANTSRAFYKLKEATGQLYKSEFDVDLSRFDIPARNFPEVHPKLLSIDFYEGRFIPNDNQYDPKTRQIQFKESDKNVSINHLISRVKSQSFISIVGYPGAGKTTLSKRLARRLDETRDFLVLRIPFMSMNDCDDEELTLKEFLLGDVDFDLNTEEKDSVFKWIKKHTKKCFLILDGFDQVNWNLMDKVKRSNYDTLLTCQELVSNLCRGTFLPNCHIVFTSRPHAMLTIPKQCRPKKTYFVGDLTSENMKILVDALVNDEQKSSEILNKLTVETPHLESMCHNPLMLQLYLRAFLSSSDETANISTVTTIFQRVLGGLRTSQHTIALADEIVLKLSRIAYNATKNGTVVITAEDLQTENLLSKDVQDIVVALFALNKHCGLFEGNQRLYFSHQTFQEFFSALYMTDQMPLDNFTSFVQTNLLVDHWSVVVQFLSGLLLDSCMNEGEKRQKREIFISEFYEKTRKVAADHKDGRSIIAISRILREGNDEDVTVAAGRHFDGGRINMKSSDTQNDFHAVTSFLKSMPGRIGMLNLLGCKMNSNQFRPWKEAIKSMPGSIVGMNLFDNLLSVNDVIEVIFKVEEEVWMFHCLDDGDGRWRVANMMERSMLKEALDGSDNKKLKIMVGYLGDVITHKDRDD